MDPVQRYAPVAGRLLLSLIFLVSAAGKLGDWSGTTGYMASRGMPAVELFLAGAVVLEIGGGLGILLGFRTRWAALALIVFLVPATLIFHDFWAHEGPQHREQMIHFLKNLALMGGILFVAGRGPGPLGLDRSDGGV